jgi:DNA polymerase-3 subunit epsilon
MTVATILLTKGNLNSNHFYLTSCLNMFPPAAIGGKSETEQATLKLKVRPAFGEEVMTDIDGTKNIFRNRGWVGKLFRVSEAKVGEAVQIKKLSEFGIDVRVVSGGAI